MHTKLFVMVLEKKINNFLITNYTNFNNNKKINFKNNFNI